MPEQNETKTNPYWTILSDNTVELDPMISIGAGHLEVYKSDPGRFESGVAVKDPPPPHIVALFEEMKLRGEALRVNIKASYGRPALEMILQYQEAAERYPWRLVFAHPPTDN